MDPERRATLWRDLAAGLLEHYGGAGGELIAAADGWLGGEGGLLARLEAFEAYSDPLAKKAQLYAKICERRGWFEALDPEAWDVSADSVLMRVALRSGLVAEGGLEEVREATRDAFRQVAAEAGSTRRSSTTCSGSSAARTRISSARPGETCASPRAIPARRGTDGSCPRDRRRARRARGSGARRVRRALRRRGSGWLRRGRRPPRDRRPGAAQGGGSPSRRAAWRLGEAPREPGPRAPPRRPRDPHPALQARRRGRSREARHVLPRAPRPRQQLGSRRPLRAHPAPGPRARRSARPARPAARFSEPLGPAHRRARDVLADQGRSVDRDTAVRGGTSPRRRGPDPQGGGVDAARSRQARRGGVARLPRPPRERDAEDDAALLARAAPEGRPRPVHGRPARGRTTPGSPRRRRTRSGRRRRRGRTRRSASARAARRPAGATRSPCARPRARRGSRSPAGRGR